MFLAGLSNQTERKIVSPEFRLLARLVEIKS
jgi:hypothetical protein